MDGANCHNYDVIGLYHITFFYKNEKERCKSKDNLMIYLLIKYIFLSIKIYIYKKGAYSTIERCDCMGLWSHVTIQKKRHIFLYIALVWCLFPWNCFTPTMEIEVERVNRNEPRLPLVTTAAFI